MTTTLTTQTPINPATTLEHVDIHRALEIPPVPAAEKRPRRWMNKMTAVGLTAAVAGLAIGYGAAAWSYSDQIDQLQNQAQITTSVPFGGFSSEYGATREHLALAEIAATGMPTGYDPLDHPVADILLETQR